MINGRQVGQETATSCRELRIVLELDLGVDPISGRIRADGEPAAFDGWLQLVAALEAMRTAATGGKA